jgi:hypothetical protein
MLFNFKKHKKVARADKLPIGSFAKSTDNHLILPVRVIEMEQWQYDEMWDRIKTETHLIESATGYTQMTQFEDKVREIMKEYGLTLKFSVDEVKGDLNISSYEKVDKISNKYDLTDDKLEGKVADALGMKWDKLKRIR